MPRPQFGEFGPNRGSQRGGWRGRGNNPFNGRGGRGGGDGPTTSDSAYAPIKTQDRQQ